MTTLVEDDVEQVALDWLGQLDWQIAHGTSISDDVCGASMRVSPPCGYCLKASTSLRHGRIQQVLSVAFLIRPSGLRIKSVMTGRTFYAPRFWIKFTMTVSRSTHPVDIALKPVRACATVVSSRYSAWRFSSAPLDCGSSPQ